MATAALTVVAEGTPAQWAPGGPYTPVQAVTIDDGDTGYIGTDGESAALAHRFTLSDPAEIDEDATISNVTLRAKFSSPDEVNVTIRLRGVLGAEALHQDASTGDPTYSTVTLSMDTKPGGGAWTRADVYALQAEVRDPALAWILCTYIDGTVTFENPPPPPPAAPAYEGSALRRFIARG